MQHAECWVLLEQLFRVEHCDKAVKRFPMLEKLLKCFLVSDLSVPVATASWVIRYQLSYTK